MTRIARARLLVVVAVVGGLLVGVQHAATAVGAGGISGSVDDPFAGTKDSFSVDSTFGATTFSASDSASFSDASVAADQHFVETVTGSDLEQVDVDGSVTASVGTTQLLASGNSDYSVGFGGELDFTLTGSMSVSSEDQTGDAAIAQVRIEDDSGSIVDIRIAAQDGSDSTAVNETGTLPAGGSLSVTANVGVGAPPSDNTATAEYDLRLTLSPASCGGTRPDRRAGAAVGQCAPTGHIVYNSPAIVGSRLVVLSVEGTNPTNPLLLADGGQNLESPAWEPNGQHIAVVHGGEIFVMTAGGSDLRQLTSTGGNNDAPDWSPDGSRIAFVSTRDGNAEIYVMDADGTHQRRLTTGGAVDTTPRWSPGGQKLVFVSDRRGQFDVFTLNANGTGTPARLTNDPGKDIQPDFGPGGVIVFATDRDDNAEIYSMRATGQDQTNLTQDPGRQTRPRISPDGNFVAFANGNPSSQDISVMGIAGGPATNLTNTPGESETDPDWGNSACTRYGSNGNDVITASGFLCGGSGDDTLTGGTTGDVLDGGMDDDRLSGKGGPDVLFGGDETPSGPAAVNDRLEGGEATDHIFAGAGNDVVSGGGGSDIIFGDDGKDDIEGDLGTPSPQKDFLHGGPGNDTIAGGAGPDQLFGEQGIDTLEGDAGGDKMVGGPDKDVLTGCDGDTDTMSGGPGTRPGDAHDTATFDFAIDQLTSIEVRHRCP